MWDERTWNQADVHGGLQVLKVAERQQLLVLWGKWVEGFWAGEKWCWTTRRLLQIKVSPFIALHEIATQKHGRWRRPEVFVCLSFSFLKLKNPSLGPGRAEGTSTWAACITEVPRFQSSTFCWRECSCVREKKERRRRRNDGCCDSFLRLQLKYVCNPLKTKKESMFCLHGVRASSFIEPLLPRTCGYVI